MQSASREIDPASRCKAALTIRLARKAVMKASDYCKLHYCTRFMCSLLPHMKHYDLLKHYGLFPKYEWMYVELLA
jgi:hypothetical protein